MAELKYQRILLKLGGEALAGEGGFGINPRQAEFLAQRVVNVVNMDVQVAVVIGGGNMWRGKQDGMDHGMERVTADHIGMLATVMNALALQDALERVGVPTRVMTGIEVRAVAVSCKIGPPRAFERPLTLARCRRATARTNESRPFAHARAPLSPPFACHSLRPRDAAHDDAVASNFHRGCRRIIRISGARIGE